MLVYLLRQFGAWIINVGVKGKVPLGESRRPPRNSESA
jgi:hypothetical protein